MKFLGLSLLLRNQYMNASFQEKHFKRFMTTPIGIPGTGTGQGDGSTRKTGGGMGRFGASREDEYFYNKKREQLNNLRKKQMEELKKTKKKDDD